MKLIRQIIVAGGVSLGVFRIAASSLETWHPRSPLPTPETLYSITFGNGRFVAVGANGVIVTSTNGIDWTNVSSPTALRLNTVTFGANRFVVGGDRGLLLWSEDGKNWVNASVAVNAHITAVGFGAGTNFSTGRFVAIGSTFGPSSTASINLISDSGTNWTVVASQGEQAFYRSFRSIAFGHDRFVLSGENGVSTFYSSSGTSWFRVTGDPQGPLAFGNGIFVAANGFISTTNGTTVFSRQSANGANWTYQPFQPFEPGLGLCHGATGFVAVGPRRLAAQSSDGTNWTTAAMLERDDGKLWSVTFGNDVYVAVGDGGATFSSPDGTDWTRRSIGPSRDLYSVFPADEGFVAAGVNGTIGTSSNGMHWTAFQAPTTNALRVALKGNGKYVFAGGGVVLTGTEVTDLVAHPSFAGQAFNGGTFANGRFILMASGTMAVSEDAENWSFAPTGLAQDLSGIAFGGGRLIGVGNNGTIASSTDGLTWEAQPSPTNWNFAGIVFGNGTFVATSAYGFISSRDGISWEVTTGVSDRGIFGSAVTFGSGFFLVPQTYSGVLVSRDGRKWQQLDTSRPVWLGDFAFNNGTFVSAGRFGRIYQSDPIVRLVQGPGHNEFSVDGPTDAVYKIEATETPADPLSWSEVVTLATPPYTWSDTAGSGSSKRFYRTLLVEPSLSDQR